MELHDGTVLARNVAARLRSAMELSFLRSGAGELELPDRWCKNTVCPRSHRARGLTAVKALGPPQLTPVLRSEHGMLQAVLVAL